MLTAIAKKEFLEHLASFRFWIGASLAVVLAGLATVIAAEDHDLRLMSYRDRSARLEAELEAVHVYSFVQPVAMRAPEPLSILDQGFDQKLGTDVRIHLFTVPAAAAGGQRGNELMVTAMPIDLTTIVSVVLGLLALLLTSDAIAGERMEGTLRTSLSHAVSRRTVLAGKALGGLATIAVPLAATLAVSVLILVFRSEVGLAPEHWWRLAGLAASYVLYLSLMLLLGLTISLYVRRAASALVVAILAWLAIVIVLPSAAWAVAGELVEAQEARRLAEDRAAELAVEHERLLARELSRHPLLGRFSGHTSPFYVTAANRAVLRRYGSAAYYDALVGFHAFEVAAGMRLAEEVFATHRQHEARLLAGQRLGTALAAASPAFLLDRLSESFAATSVDDHDRFLAACRGYRARLVGYLKSRQAVRSWRWFTDDPPGGTRPWPTLLGVSVEEVDEGSARLLFGRVSEPAVQERLRRERAELEEDQSRRLDLAGMPRFSYRGPGAVESFRRAAPEAAALLLVNAVLTVVAWLRFERYEIG